MVEVIVDYFITGACHAPVRSNQEENQSMGEINKLPAGRKGTFDGWYSCQKCFCVTFIKSNKIEVINNKYEYEANNQCYGW